MQRLNRLATELRAWRRFIGLGTTDGARLWVAEAANLDRSADEPGRFRGEAWDPQLRLAGLPTIHGQSGPAIFEATLRVESGALIRPMLFLDRGAGFDEAGMTPLYPVGGGKLAGRIADMKDVRGLRFDPSEGPVSFRLEDLRLRRPRPGEPDPADVAEESVDPGLALLPDVRLSGVKVVARKGLEPTDAPGIFALTDSDPQIVFTPTADGHRGAMLCRFTFEVESMDGMVTTPRLYLDYGDEGFSQDGSFALARQADGRYHAIVAYPALCPGVRWDPSDRRGTLRIISVTAQPQSLAALQDAVEAPYSPSGVAATTGAPDRRERKAWAERAVAFSRELNETYYNASAALAYDYDRWVKVTERQTPADYERMRLLLAQLAWRPRFSFVMPTYNTPPDLLESCVRSMLDQVYPDFEICIADDHSSDPRVRATLERLAAEDDRIKLAFRPANGHISEASNTALALATGDFVVLVDHDDILPDYALLTVADYLNEHRDAKILYSDEDKLDPSGKRCDPYFKSDFNRFLMFGHNMVSHLGVYQRALVQSVGGFRPGYEGSQDYDLFLRCLERCSDAEVIHIPHVLYHWRMIPGSTAVSADQKSYAIVAAQRSINDFLNRQALPFEVVDGVAAGLTRLAVIGAPLATTVSIIIPTRDRLDLLKPCIDSLFAAPDAGVEIVIVDNGSQEAETLAYLADLASLPNVKVVSAPGPFNFSGLCNQGVAASSGDIICLLNNDTELVTADWLDRARALLATPDVGIVGARLIYPDQSVQHFGLYLGMGAHGVAGTPHRGLPMSDFGPFGKARLIQEFSAVTAACLFVTRAVYDQVGGFDRDLEVAYNDVDFCLKVRALGRRVLCDPDIVLVHKESKSRGDDLDGARAHRLETEARLMRERWAELLVRDPYYNPNLTLDRDDFSLADSSRIPFPWRRPSYIAAQLRSR